MVHVRLPLPAVLWYNKVGVGIMLQMRFSCLNQAIKIDFHFVQEKVARKDLEIRFVSTVDEITYIITKRTLFSTIFGSMFQLNVISPNFCL